MKDNKNYRLRALIFNPLILIIHGISSYYLYSLLKYGGVKRKLPIIVLAVIIEITWFLWSMFKYRKEKKPSSYKAYLKTWYFIGVFIFITTTMVTGVNIYKSASNFNGKLSWLIHDLKSKRKVKFTNDNIYDNGLEGVFEDIDKKLNLPEELYLSNEFRLKFDKDGYINSIYGYIYGKNKKGEIESFLISYDRDKSKDIIVYIEGHVDGSFREEMKLEPLLEMMDWISLKDAIEPCDQEEYSLLYAGVRSWGHNPDGIIYINKNPETGQIEIKEDRYPKEEIIGYSLSLYIAGKEDTIMPIRYIHGGLKISPREEKKEWKLGYNPGDGEESYFLNEKIGYQLRVVDAALGSRFYSLFRSQDGGQTWQVFNEDPFLGNTGVSSGITFIDEDLGFIGLSHSGGSYGELYRTEDGGISFEQVELPEIQVELNNGESYNPFDFPEMPYEEDGKLILIIGQGQDGDYNGGIKANFESTDRGKIFISR